MTVAPAPRSGVEVQGKRRELFHKLAHGREGWLPNYCVERHGRHASADHFGDGRHRGGDGSHVVCGGEVFFLKVLTMITSHGESMALQLTYHR